MYAKLGKLLVLRKALPDHLRNKVESGAAHWVTIKEGPLEGRHILIDGPRPAPGHKSSGVILAGKGIPLHVIQKITHAHHAGEVEHETAQIPENEQPKKLTALDTYKSSDGYYHDSEPRMKANTHRFHSLRLGEGWVKRLRDHSDIGTTVYKLGETGRVHVHEKDHGDELVYTIQRASYEAKILIDKAHPRRAYITGGDMHLGAYTSGFMVRRSGDGPLSEQEADEIYHHYIRPAFNWAVVTGAPFSERPKPMTSPEGSQVYMYDLQDVVADPSQKTRSEKGTYPVQVYTYGVHKDGRNYMVWRSGKKTVVQEDNGMPKEFTNRQVNFRSNYGSAALDAVDKAVKKYDAEFGHDDGEEAKKYQAQKRRKEKLQQVGKDLSTHLETALGSVGVEKIIFNKESETVKDRETIADIAQKSFGILKQLIPNSAMKVTKVRVVLGKFDINWKGAWAYYRRSERTIFMSSKKGMQPFFHEYGHAFDHALSGQANTYSSKQQHGFLKPLIDEIHKTAAFNKLMEWAKTRKADRSGSFGPDYYASPEETFARFFAVYVQRQAKAKGVELPNELVEGERFERFTDDEFSHLADTFHACLKKAGLNKSMFDQLFDGEKPLSKSKLGEHLAAKVRSGEAHWVTVKEGPLEGRHLLIDGPRPEGGAQSKGRILAGHGIPNHVIEKLGGTHAHQVKHEQSDGPEKAANVDENGNHWYSYRLRGLSTGAQPRGHVDHDPNVGRHGAVAYNRPLTPAELDDYELNPHNAYGATQEDKPREPWQMTLQQYRESKQGQHPETTRVQWMSSVRQKVHVDGPDSIKHLYQNDPGFEQYVRNGFKTPRAPKPKIAGEGMPFNKEQSTRNNEFLNFAEGMYHYSQDLSFKEARKILHEKGYDAATEYIGRTSNQGDKYTSKLSGGKHAGKTPMEALRELAEADKEKGNGLAPGQSVKAPEPAKTSGDGNAQTYRLYHGTHQKISKFGPVDVKGYNSIGSWFTSDPEKAKGLYGPNVHEAHVELKNPLVSTNVHGNEDFFDHFVVDKIAKQHLPSKDYKKLWNGAKWNDEVLNKLLNNRDYISAVKQHYEKLGHDGIVMRNSRVDVDPNGKEGQHDVVIAFHPETQVKSNKQIFGSPADEPKVTPKAGKLVVEKPAKPAETTQPVMMFPKKQTTLNNDWLNHADFMINGVDNKKKAKELNRILNEQGFDAARKYVSENLDLPPHVIERGEEGFEWDRLDHYADKYKKQGMGVGQAYQEPEKTPKVKREPRTLNEFGRQMAPVSSKYTPVENGISASDVKFYNFGTAHDSEGYEKGKNEYQRLAAETEKRTGRVQSSWDRTIRVGGKTMGHLETHDGEYVVAHLNNGHMVTARTQKELRGKLAQHPYLNGHEDHEETGMYHKPHQSGFSSELGIDNRDDEGATQLGFMDGFDEGRKRESSEEKQQRKARESQLDAENEEFWNTGGKKSRGTRKSASNLVSVGGRLLVKRSK